MRFFVLPQKRQNFLNTFSCFEFKSFEEKDHLSLMKIKDFDIDEKFVGSHSPLVEGGKNSENF
ncbi:hypothetical protein DRF60_16920 [Chryseobacterium elymi]|uniref:Uncharacterized protein n=1 Tax=Chryseobacterium elymi TaxID=395936 RepID=A0A3D9D9Z0_9FLAO|nr:hypothetical protein DRF60_16920 [Chryseobacterium elymi]